MLLYADYALVVGLWSVDAPDTEVADTVDRAQQPIQVDLWVKEHTAGIALELERRDNALPSLSFNIRLSLIRALPLGQEELFGGSWLRPPSRQMSVLVTSRG